MNYFIFNLSCLYTPPNTYLWHCLKKRPTLYPKLSTAEKFSQVNPMFQTNCVHPSPQKPYGGAYTSCNVMPLSTIKASRGKKASRNSLLTPDRTNRSLKDCAWSMHPIPFPPLLKKANSRIGKLFAYTAVIFIYALIFFPLNSKCYCFTPIYASSKL